MGPNFDFNKRFGINPAGETAHAEESHPQQPGSKRRPVIICTEQKVIQFGYADDTTGTTVVLYSSRNCIYWSVTVGGLEGLASRGPDEKCRISTTLKQGEFRNVCAVWEVEPLAEQAWNAAPTCE